MFVARDDLADTFAGHFILTQMTREGLLMPV